MRRKNYPIRLQASGSADDASLCAMSAPLELLAAAAGDKRQVRRFQMDAYNGGPMRFPWNDLPVVVDLAGMAISDHPRPIYRDHNERQIIGHTTKITNDGRKLRIEGIVSGAGPAAREVVDSADNGFPWQASIGADIKRPFDRIRAGVTAVVNGQTLTGPFDIVRQSSLMETSFVPIGADDSTKARMSARRSITTVPQEKPVDYEAWLKAQGFDLAALTDTQKASLRAAYDAHVLAAKAADDARLEAGKTGKAKKGKAGKLQAAATTDEDEITADEDGDETARVDALKAQRAEAAAEKRRQAGIDRVCGTKHGELAAKAIEENWSVDKTELEVLRASRMTGPAIGGSASGDKGVTKDLLEVAVLQAQHASEDSLKKYGERTLEAADKRFHGRIGLQELILEAAWANGYAGRSFRQDPRAVLRAAFALQADGFSTVDIGGILSNIANKSLLDGFRAVEQIWRRITKIRPVNDFKTHTSYRLTGANQYEKVGNGGEIKHGKLGSESFTNKAETYAKILGLSRQDMINDDLGALGDVPRMLGRGAALKLNDVFWTEFMNNASFFATGNNNYFSGSTTNLSIDSLTTGEQKFLDQVDADSKPLALLPKFLLVPTALSAIAAALMRSTDIRDTTASTKYPTANPHAGKWEVLVSAYLSNSTITGFSSTAWHLIADPADLPVIETCFLNGQEAPVVETAQAEFSTLGIEMRGYHDFGVTKQDSRAGVKSKGAA